MQFSFGWNRAGAQTPASISSSRLQDRNFTQRGPRKCIDEDFMGKRRNCGVNEHLCFCTDANDTQQVTTRCIIAPYFIGGSERCCVREHHAPSLQVPARLQAGGTRSSKAPSPDHRSALPDRPESFPAFRHGCKDDAHALSDSALTSGVQGFSPGAGKSAAFALLWLFRCGDFRDLCFYISIFLLTTKQDTLSTRMSCFVKYSYEKLLERTNRNINMGSSNTNVVFH